MVSPFFSPSHYLSPLFGSPKEHNKSMCGIAGFAARTLPESALESVRAMTDSMARRGPDAEGIHAWPNAIFGHRRLAIFDLSDAGRQPMLSSNSQVGVVFNGAIYNFHELRAELSSAATASTPKLIPRFW